MSTEEVFIVHFTLKEYKLDYDKLDNPKLSMIEQLSKYYGTSIENGVWLNIKDIPNTIMRNQVIEFLFRNFLICNNNPESEIIEEYWNLPLDKAYELFNNDKNFAFLLIESYYKMSVNPKILENGIESTTKEAGNLFPKHTISNKIININDKLHRDMLYVVEDFLRNGSNLNDIMDIFYNIIVEGYIFKSDGTVKCENELNEIYYYRNYLIKLMVSEVYEDILYNESILGEELESELYNVSQYDDEDYEEFNNIVKALINNNSSGMNIPSEFYEDLINEYFYIISDEERKEYNRKLMIVEHPKVLKRINPLYMFDGM